MIRLPDLHNVGAGGVHRSGWPFAMAALEPLLSDAGTLLDDFIERTFLYGVPHGVARRVWREPWVGILHHPPNMPSYFLPTATLRNLEGVPEFRESRERLLGVIALSEYLASWVRRTWQVPAVCIKHPTEVPELTWSLEAYLANPRVVQVGWYLRNPDAIHQLKAPKGVKKILLVPNNKSRDLAAKNVRRLSPTRRRTQRVPATTVPHLSAQKYDELLSSSVTFGEYFDCSASNTVIESIARQTPILLNRHPALEEYLGPAYPLFYERFEDAGSLLTPERVEEAHTYLKALPVPWISGEAFCRSVASFVRSVTLGVAA